MATQVATARPVQALRQRRESARPGLARVSTRATTADAMDSSTVHSEPTPYVVTSEYILRKFAGSAPSLILHMHPTHFRFDQQDGNFGYNSEMRFLLEHIKYKTVPHEILEELFSSGVKFYDGCLIVEIHNHRVGADANAANATHQVGGSTQKPYSIHNWNELITPSPYVAFPEQSMKASSPSKASEKQPMPAPEQPASAMQKKGPKSPKVFTTVLFPTPLSLNEEMNMLARTPYTERSAKRQLNGQPTKDGATPTAHPPTPLTSVPPTPLTAKGPSKHPQMILTEDNAHEWEAEVINRTAPPLLLEPAKNFAESQAFIEALAHPLHSASPPAPKARKRTIAELAADEAQAASEERFMLTYDERHQTLLAGGAAGGTAELGGRAGGAGSFEPTFKRFKMLESVRMEHAAKERAKKEEEAHKAHLKRQQTEAESAKKRERAEHDRQLLQQHQQRQAQQQENLQRQQQIQAAQRAAAEHAQQTQQHANMATPVSANAQQMPMSMAQAPHTQLQQVSQASQMSPVVRQQTPMSASPTMNGTPMTTVAMTSVPMAASASNQGAGSPARPPSAMQQHHIGLGMVRQPSQQHGSGHGTPQVQNTPSMPSAIPVTRHMTPTPRVNPQGSPMPGQMQNGTPMMMPSQLATPTPGQQMTPEQRQHIARQQQMMQQARQVQHMQQMGNPITQQQQALLIQFQQSQRQAQHAQQLQQMGTPTPQGVMPHMSQPMQMNSSQMGMQPNGMSPQGQNMMGAQNPVMNNIQQKMNQAKNQLQNQYMGEARQRQQAFLARFGGMQPPPDQALAFQQAEQQHKVRAAQLIDQRVNMIGKSLMQQAQGQANGMLQNGGMGMGMGQQVNQGMGVGGQNPAMNGMMPNVSAGGMSNGMGGQVGQPNNPAQQQYMVQLQQQRQQMAARQRVQAMQQMGAQQGGLGVGGQNGMGQGMGQGVMPQSMSGMPNVQGMSQQQIMALQQQMMANRQQHQMNMGGMQGGMNGGGMM